MKGTDEESNLPKLPRVLRKGRGDRATLSYDKIRFEKVESPDQLIHGMDELLAQSCQINHMWCESNKWKVIYQGILNPMSHQGKLLRNSLDRRK